MADLIDTLQELLQGGKTHAVSLSRVRLKARLSGSGPRILGLVLLAGRCVVLVSEL